MRCGLLVRAVTQEGLRDEVVNRLEDSRFAGDVWIDSAQCGYFANEQNAVVVVSRFVPRRHQPPMNISEDGLVLRDSWWNRECVDERNNHSSEHVFHG